MNEIDRQQLASLFPRASKSFIEANTGLRATQRKLSGLPPLAGKVPRQRKSNARPVVRIVVFRVRLLDKENLNAGTKSLTDCLCEVGLISGDSEAEVDLQISQQKVNHYADQHTEVTITYGCSPKTIA